MRFDFRLQTPTRPARGELGITCVRHLNAMTWFVPHHQWARFHLLIPIQVESP